MQLIAESSSEKYIDYSAGIITRYYQEDGARYYFTLHPEQYPEEDALTPTGRWLAVILTPKGLKIFYLVQDEVGNYIPDLDEGNQQPLGNPDEYETRGGMKAANLPAMQRELQLYNSIKAYLPLLNKALLEEKNV